MEISIDCTAITLQQWRIKLTQRNLQQPKRLSNRLLHGPGGPVPGCGRRGRAARSDEAGCAGADAGAAANVRGDLYSNWRFGYFIP